MQLPLYRIVRTKRGMKLVPYMRAYGRQKRTFSPDTYDRCPIPYSKYERRALSEPAKALQDTWRQDEHAEKAAEWLVAHLAAQIARRADFEDWGVGADERGSRVMAMVLLHPAIHQEDLSWRAAARLAGVSHGAFQKNWRPKLQIFSGAVVGWAQELDQ